MNNLTGISVSGLSYLTYLDCSDNLISGIDFTNCYNITGLYLQNNNLSGQFNLSQFKNLSGVDISDNQFTGIIASGLTNLVYINASGNNISGIQLSGSINITGLNLADNNLSGNLDLTEFEELKEVNVSDNNLTNVKITGLNKLETFIANNNIITGAFNLIGATNIREILIYNNLITGLLNFNDLTQINYFNISDNSILDLTPIVFWATGQNGLVPVASGIFGI